MMCIELKDANHIIAAAFQKGQEIGAEPLTVAVLDRGGHLIALQRQDQASFLRPQIAVAKAAGALALGVSSRRIGEMAAERPVFVASVSSLAPSGIVPAAGGVIVANSDGNILGAVGITGDTSDKDEICAVAGIAAVGLVAQV